MDSLPERCVLLTPVQIITKRKHCVVTLFTDARKLNSFINGHAFSHPLALSLPNRSIS
jgi:hypothetical protein